MVIRVNSSLPAVVNQSQSHVTPLVTVFALAALAYVLIQAAKSLIGRVLPIVDPEKWFQEGFADFENELYDESIKKFTLALKCNPNQNLHTRILVAQGLVYRRIKQYDKAIEDFTSTLGCNLNQNMRTHVLVNRAVVYRIIKEYDKAIEDLTSALGCNPSDPNVLMSIYFERGSSNLMLKNFDDVISDLAKALEYDSKDPKTRAGILLKRAHTFSCQKKFDLCEIDLSDAIACRPNRDEVRLFWKRGETRVKLKRYQEAIQDFTTAMDINPADEGWKAQLLYSRGVAHRENKNPVQACRDWQAALRCIFTDQRLRVIINVELNKQSARKGSAVLGG